MNSKKTLSLDDIKHLAKLANLKLKEEEMQSLLPQVISFLEYVSKIQSLKTDGVEETSQVTGKENVFREDVVDQKRMLAQEAALSGAKRKHNGYFVVPAIFEE